MECANLTLLGTGLIGGSLGLALKQSGFAHTITGYSRHNYRKAQELGIIDVGTDNLAEAVKEADIIVVSTPLGTYPVIAEQLADTMKEGAILTDAGSVKAQPSQHILEKLHPSQHPYFVPGHPIAGTEHSGPEAAFASLYQGKNVLLTPHASVGTSALATVQAMWESAGAHVNSTIDANTHDRIYAHVSHAIQFLSSSYGIWLQRLFTQKPELSVAIKQYNEPYFRQFIRLTGSDITMWQDIYQANHNHLTETIRQFIQLMQNWVHILDQQDSALLEQLLHTAHDARSRFRENHVNLSPTPLGTITTEPLVILHLLPRLIAAAIMQQTEESEYGFAVGAGFRGFTRHNLLHQEGDSEYFLRHHTMLIPMLQSFLSEVETTLDLITSDNRQDLHDTLSIAKTTYRHLYIT